MEHELVLGPLEVEEGTANWDRNPELYYWTVFGEPGGDGPWGWRTEGHHVSLHINCWSDKVISVTPFFLGANPAEVLKGDKQGLRILDRREDIAFESKNIVLIFGGSNVDERRIAVEETTAHAVNDYLQNKTGGRVAAVNLGVDGHTLLGNLYSLINWIPFIMKSFQLLKIMIFGAG